MAEVVDSIIAQLEVRLGNYVTNMETATKAADALTAAHKRLTESDTGQVSAQQMAETRKQAANDVAAVEEQTTAKVTRTRKTRSDAVKSADEADVASAKAAAAERDRIAERGAQRDANPARRVIRSNRVEPAAAGSSRIGATVAREGSGQSSIPLSYLNGATTVAEAAPQVEREVNALLADRFDLAQKVKAAEGETKRELQDQVAYLQRIDTYKRAGLTDDAAVLRAETEIAAVEKIRAERQAKPAGGGQVRQFGRFAEGATLGRTGGNSAAVTGLVTAAAIGGGVAIVDQAAKYGKEIQETATQLGLSTKDLQVYQVAAQRAGATNEQLSSAFAHLNDQIGRAREGDAAIAKLFNKDNLNIDPSTFKTLGDALPTVIDRLSKIEDPVKRSAVGVRLFGDEYRRLDPLLSSGNDKLKQLAVSLADTILSDSQIDHLDETSKKLGDVSRQLQVDFAKTVGDNAQSITSLAGALGQLTGEVIRFLNSHPQSALTIIGALAGSRVGGLPGAAVGAVAGYAVGQKVSDAQADTNRDLAFRRAQYQAAQRNLVARQQASSAGAPLFSLSRNDAADGGSRTNDGGDSGTIFALRHTDPSKPAVNTTVVSAEREVARQRGLYQQALAFAKANPDKPQGAV